jgi:antitoxin YefM
MNWFDKTYEIPYHCLISKEVQLTVLKVSEARANLYQLLDETAQSHQPVTITGKRHNAVLVSEDDWRSVQETLYLVSIPGMRESIIEGMQTPVEECAEELEW